MTDPIASHTFHLESGVLVERYSGTLTADFVAECMQQSAAFLSESPSTPILVDLTRCTFASEFYPGASMVNTHNNLHRGGRTALLADTPIATAFAILFANAIKSRDLRVFSTIDAARAWLTTGHPT